MPLIVYPVAPGGLYCHQQFEIGPSVVLKKKIQVPGTVKN